MARMQADQYHQSTFCAVMLLAVFYGQRQLEPPSFRVSSELVVVDLVAINAEGRFVSDLRSSDVQIREDGKSQNIQLFLRLSRDVRESNMTANTEPSPGTPAVSLNAATLGTGPPSLVIALDFLSTAPELVSSLKTELHQWLSELGSDIPIMLATIGSETIVRQSFTTDRQRLGAAIDALPLPIDRPLSVKDLLDRVDQLCTTSNANTLANTATDIGRELIAETTARSQSASRSLAALADWLASMPGRKQLVLYSSGYAISPAQQAVDAVSTSVSACNSSDLFRVRRVVSEQLAALNTTTTRDGILTVVDRANRAQVTLYTIDATGLTTDAVLPQYRGRSQSGGGRLPVIKLLGLDSGVGRDYLERLAVDTGGRTFRNTNDRTQAARMAVADASDYYLIGYVPSSKQSTGRFRKITVTVNRPKLQLIYRRGYFENSSK